MGLDDNLFSTLTFAHMQFAKFPTVQLIPGAKSRQKEDSRKEVGGGGPDWVEQQMKAVDGGAQFAMLGSIKLYGGKTVPNTIKAMKTRKSQTYELGGRGGTKPCKVSRTAQENQTNQHPS